MRTRPQGGECRGDRSGRPVQFWSPGPIARRYSLAPFQLSIVHCQLSIEKRLCQFVKTSNESPEKGLPCTKIRVGDHGAPSRAICVLRRDSLFACSLSFCILFRFVRFLPSVFSHGRTQYHTSGIVPLRALKNENRGLFSYGRTTTTVRTRRYGGADASVRSQSQVLRMVKMGAADAFSALGSV